MGVRAPNRSVVSIKTNSTRLLRPAPHSTPPEEAVGLEHLRWVQRRSHPRDRKPYDTTGIVHGELTRGAEPIGDPLEASAVPPIVLLCLAVGSLEKFVHRF
jgi:hypothetical protein